MGLTGLEPVTPRLSSACSNQLSYRPVTGGGKRIRTADILLAKQTLYQLSYTPENLLNMLFRIEKTKSLRCVRFY